MKRTDEMRPEYDFAGMPGGTRAKYVKRLREKTNVVMLEPEIAEAFPNDRAVNQALRAVLNATPVVQRSGDLSTKARRRRKKAGPPRRARS
jgi:hypothetical protein